MPSPARAAQLPGLLRAPVRRTGRPRRGRHVGRVYRTPRARRKRRCARRRAPSGRTLRAARQALGPDRPAPPKNAARRWAWPPRQSTPWCSPLRLRRRPRGPAHRPGTGT